MILILALLLSNQSGKLAPVNDAGKEPGFTRYVSKLKKALSSRDPKALRKLVDSEVIIGGFSAKDERGWDQFALRWDVGNKESMVWDTLTDLVELGFFREVPSIYVTPYVAWKFPKELDERDYWVVLRDALPLRAQPSRDAAVVGLLAFDIVKRKQVGQGNDAFDWVLVETLDGKQGYVQAAVLRSPLMARAQFALKNGQWYLSVLDRAKTIL